MVFLEFLVLLEVLEILDWGWMFSCCLEALGVVEMGVVGGVKLGVKWGLKNIFSQFEKKV